MRGRVRGWVTVCVPQERSDGDMRVRRDKMVPGRAPEFSTIETDTVSIPVVDVARVDVVMRDGVRYVFSVAQPDPGVSDE